MNILFRVYLLSPKKFPEETWPKIYLGQDPDVSKSRIRIQSKLVRIRIRSKIVRIPNTAVRSCQIVLKTAMWLESTGINKSSGKIEEFVLFFKCGKNLPKIRNMSLICVFICTAYVELKKEKSGKVTDFF
jgi:hypothetical protein